jgi:hypothetical protein
MRYIPNTEEQKKEMLKDIGVSSFEDLIESVPQNLRFLLYETFVRCWFLSPLYPGNRKISSTERRILDLLHPLSTRIESRHLTINI